MAFILQKKMSQIIRTFFFIKESFTNSPELILIQDLLSQQ